MYVGECVCTYVGECVCMCVGECVCMCVGECVHVCECVAMASTFTSAAVRHLCFFSFLIQALPGPHYYTWGDHGGIIMAIAQGMETNELK